MRTKHWAYIGVALIAVNASLLGRARAAELLPGYSQPGFHLFRSHFSAFWSKPQPIILAPVAVRLFSDQNLQALWIKDSAGFKLADRKLKGALFIELRNGVLNVYSQHRCQMTASDLNLQSLGDSAYELKTRQGSHKWTRGDLHLRVIKGRIQVVNRLELEDYVSGILEGELGTLNLSPEVLKAQIIVARSYVLSMRGERHHGEGFEFCDHPHCQVYSGIPMHNPVFDAAIRSVRGQYLSYKGRPVAAFYHHSCGGETSAVEDVWPSHSQPYLRAVTESPDSSCRVSSRWRARLSKKILVTCFQRTGWLKRGDTLEAVQVIRKDRSGRVQDIMIQSSRKSVKVSVGHFRNAINQFFGRELLKSALFTISADGNSFVVSGRGWGHGVGFCQEGAKWMSRHGKTYQQILAHYFPHTTIAQLN